MQQEGNTYYDYKKFNGALVLSIPAKLLYDTWRLISYEYYKKLCVRGKLIRTVEGKGKNNQAWVSFHDLPEIKGIDLKAYTIAKLGNPEDVVVVNELEKYIEPDPRAVDFYAEHRKPNGKELTYEKQREKRTNCEIFNAIETILKDRLKSRLFGRKKAEIWNNISEAINNLNPKDKDGNIKQPIKWHYNLPKKPRPLQTRYKQYINNPNRYMTFIHKGEGSQNARIVDKQIERLILSLYCLPNKPYAKSTHDVYLQFLGGAQEIFDFETGEVFNRLDFFDKDDQPIELSESTIKYYINKPENQILIAKVRNGDYDFNHKMRPHVNRYHGKYSMSKITLDDRDIMHTKTKEGDRVKAYYAFDDMSGALIGIAHSRKKTADLFLDCIRNMFQFTTSYGLATPMQMEVEHHLVSDFKDGLMKAGNIFSFVRWCNPTNSQEKTAERHIRNKKLGVEKANHQHVGRFYARLESNRVTLPKIYDEYNDNYKEATAEYEQIVAWELEEQKQYNNELHPDQKYFKGKTRLQVFLEKINPELPKLNKPLLSKFIGEHTQTSIRRNQYVTVQYEKYQLPTPQTIMMLAPNNYKVDAYYMPTAKGEINEVYLYQNDVFICECKPVPRFNRANAEWTEQDEAKYHEAMKYIKQFDAWSKELVKEKTTKVGISKATQAIDVPFEVVVPTPEEPQEQDFEYLFKNDSEETKNRALQEA